ncbi:hypothetical protein PG985_003959 [Apiospora marii]|uniref:uncharacterized protein n=1 Tax=Apiospora marii TaxID=335849 RepID=UPI00312D52F3
MRGARDTPPSPTLSRDWAAFRKVMVTAGGRKTTCVGQLEFLPPRGSQGAGRFPSDSSFTPGISSPSYERNAPGWVTINALRLRIHPAANSPCPALPMPTRMIGLEPAKRAQPSKPSAQSRLPPAASRLRLP